MLTLAGIKVHVVELASRLGAPRRSLLTYDNPAGDATPHIEVDCAYHHVASERGQELLRRTTGDLDELLYWVADDLTAGLARDYGLRNRIPGADSRRLWFTWQFELLGGLSRGWVIRCHAALEATLSKHPFTDGGPLHLPLPDAKAGSC